MRQANYIKLTTPKQVAVNPDPEAPTIQAPALKIVKYDSLDELHPIPHIGIYYTYGFINSQGMFVPIDTSIYYDAVVDITGKSDPVTQEVGPNGRNPMNSREQKAGNWLTSMVTPPKNQPNRIAGDFRAADLYQYLIDAVGIDGTIMKG